MNWLDSDYPAGGTAPGDVRGTCPAIVGIPAYPDGYPYYVTVTFSSIAFGDIGTTFTTGSVDTGTAPSSTPTASAPASA